VRSQKELHRIAAYIEENPVSAGLAATPEDWPWSSATGQAKACPTHASSTRRSGRSSTGVSRRKPEGIHLTVMSPYRQVDRGAGFPVAKMTCRE
jgi:hypothetical protein